MKNKIRILCLLLTLLMVLPMAFGCFGNKQEDGDESQNNGETSNSLIDATPLVSLTINGTSLADYTIVYSGKSKIGGEKAAAYLNEKLSSLYGTTLPTEKKSQKNRYEIVLGLDGDDAAIKEAYAQNPDGIIGVSGTRVILLGENYGAISQLIDAFLAKATGDGSNMSISVSAIEVPELSTLSIKVMSYNVLYDLSKPGRPADSREQMVATILENDIDVFGTQEDGPENEAAFLQLLGGAYSSYTGVSDDRDKENYIYWKTEKFDLVKSGAFYLHDAYGTRKKYEDSTQYRSMSYVILKDKVTSKQFLFVDTHLDYQASETTRTKQINVLGNLIEKINKNNLPVVILGDFNTLSTSNSGAIPKFLSNYPSYALTLNSAKTKGDVGETLVKQEDFSTRYLGAYDYIFVSVDNVVTEYFTVVDNYKEVEVTDEFGEVKTVKKYPSDHLSVMAEIKLY